jgi:hypothetical protein
MADYFPAAELVCMPSRRFYSFARRAVRFRTELLSLCDIWHIALPISLGSASSFGVIRIDGLFLGFAVVLP